MCGRIQCDLHFAGENLGPGSLPEASRVGEGVDLSTAQALCAVAHCTGVPCKHPPPPNPNAAPGVHLRCGGALDNTVNTLHVQMILLLKPQ